VLAIDFTGDGQAATLPAVFTIQYPPEPGGFLAGFTNFVKEEATAASKAGPFCAGRSAGP